MNQIPFPRADQFSISLRFALGLAGAVLVTLLCVAAWLRPEPRGQGTHQQLGLPPCTFMMLWNKPCPSCGMTTAWANVVRGRLPSAFAANVGGTLLAGIAMVAGPWLLLAAILGRPVARLPSDRVMVIAAIALMAITVLDWGLRLWNGI